MWLPTLKKLAMSMFSAATIVSPFVAVHGTKTCVTTKNTPKASHLYRTSSDTTHHTTSTPPIPPPVPVTPMPPMEDGSDLDVEGVEGGGDGVDVTEGMEEGEDEDEGEGEGGYDDPNFASG